MTETTETILRAALKADKTVDAKDMSAAMDVLLGKSPINVMPTDEGDAVIGRKQVAVMIGKSVGTVDIYGRRGVFRRVYFTKGNGKRRQSQGYSRKSVLEAIRNGGLERAEVLPEKVVKPDDALDERRRGGVVHDVGNREVDAGRKTEACILESLADGREDFYERLRIAKAIRVEEGVVVGDCVGESCCVEKGGVSLFGFHADYFTKFETPGWYPKTRLDYAMTSIFAEAMLGNEIGKAWLDHQRMYRWAEIRTDEQNAS